MRKCLLCLCVLLVAVKLQAAAGFVVLEVTKRPSWEPSIADSGEIVYLAFDADGLPNAFSTGQGQLTRSRTGLLRGPHVGEFGEIVFADRLPPSPQFQVWSSTRGLISPSAANLPSISSTGEVCFVRHTNAGFVEVESDFRGVLASMEIPTATSCDINKQGEVVYRGKDLEGRFQIFSSTRGQLTTGEHGFLGTPAINDAGTVVFVESGELVSLSQGQITSSGGNVGFFVDINGHGDIVFPLQRRESYRIVLATRSPERYPDFQTLERNILSSGSHLEVQVAIAPSREDLLLPRTKRGLVPVVIFTTRADQGEADDFDATKIDELTVRFGPEESTIVVRSMAERLDVDDDGDIDLVLWFRVRETGLGCKAGSGALRGETKEGQSFSGSAEISQPIC